MESIEKAAKENIPSVGGCSSQNRNNKLPGWSTHMKPFYEESKFWRAVWNSAGQPKDGDLACIMRHSRHQYKYALRRVQKATEKIQNDKFINSLLKGGIDIFQEIKKFRGKSGKCSSTIDGEVGAANIANHFSDIYRGLYNKHENDDLSAFNQLLNSNLNEHSIFDVDRITENVIRKGLKQPKRGKNHALYHIQSDCLSEGPPELISHLTLLIKSFFSHGYIPSVLLVCMLVPLAKDNLADLCQSDIIG